MGYADISHLGDLQPVEPLKLDAYSDNKDYVPLPPAGEYVLQSPPEFPSSSFTRTGSKALSAQVDPTIVGPTHEGFKLKFVKVSAKQWERGGTKVSQLGDYLRAFGVTETLTTEQEQANAVAGTASLTYRAILDWRAYNPRTKYTLEGMERFKSDGNGGFVPYVFDPVEKDDEGNPTRIPARLVVKRFIPVKE